MDQPADILHRRLRLPGQLAQDLAGFVRVILKQVVGGVAVQRHRCQCRTESIVKVAPDPAAFLFACRHQLLPRTLQVFGQPGRSDGDAGLPGEVGQQPPVGLSQVCLAGPWRNQQIADGFTLVEQCKGRGPVTGRACRCADNTRSILPAQGDGNVWQLQIGGDRLDDRIEHSVRWKGMLQPPAEPGQDLVGLIPPAIEQLVDHTLHQLANALEEDGDRPGCSQREPEIVAPLKDQ